MTHRWIFRFPNFKNFFNSKEIRDILEFTPLFHQIQWKIYKKTLTLIPKALKSNVQIYHNIQFCKSHIWTIKTLTIQDFFYSNQELKIGSDTYWRDLNPNRSMWLRFFDLLKELKKYKMKRRLSIIFLSIRNSNKILSLAGSFLLEIFIFPQDLFEMTLTRIWLMGTTPQKNGGNEEEIFLELF